MNENQSAENKNQINKEDNIMQNNLLVPSSETLKTVSINVGNFLNEIDTIVSSQSNYIKTSKNSESFVTSDDKNIKDIEGQIIGGKIELKRWVEGSSKPEVLPNVENEGEIPAGFKRYGELKLKVSDQECIINLPPTSLLNLKKYKDYLINNGLNLHEVMTKVFVKNIRMKHGLVPVVHFQITDRIEPEPIKVKGKVVEEEETPSDNSPGIPVEWS